MRINNIIKLLRDLFLRFLYIRMENSCVLMFILIMGCRKMTDVPIPITGTTSALVYANDASAIAVLNGVYTRMFQQGINGGINSISLCAALSADEMQVFNQASDPYLNSYYRNSLSPALTGSFDYWSNIYSNQIFTANSAIEGLAGSSRITANVKTQLLGEAKFIRAFCYFYLANLYGDVPIVLTSDYSINSTISKSKKSDVLKQVVKDLKEAKELLNDSYLNSTLLGTSNERIAPNKYAAISLLARVYLYMEDWSNAEQEASQVIANKSVYDTVDVNDVFKVDNKESIWQLQSVSKTLTNTSEARLFILPSTGPNTFPYKVFMSSAFVSGFETGDKRRFLWVDSVIANNVIYYYPKKYKNNVFQSPVTERTVILRLAEQYLIRAEARAQLNNIEGSLSDLNLIRIRAGLSQLQTGSKEQLLAQIMQERKSELFTEWGHRWLDLKRTGTADAVLASIKSPYWQPTDQLYPIPISEISKNPSLTGQQNPGY